MALDSFVNKAADVIQQAAKQTQEQVDALPPPDVDKLDRREALQMCAAVAVDAGQSLFGSALRQAGIAVFQVASSYENEEPRTYPFRVTPYLPEEDVKKQIQEELRELEASEPIIQEFVKAIGWKDASGAMKESDYTSGISDYVRDLLEWSELYRLARELNKTRYAFPIFQPILLRDGVLRFGTTGANISTPLGKLFSDLKVPIFGVTKQSHLLNNPVIRLWLKKHNVIQRDGPFCVWMKAEEFKKLGWSLERYFGKPGFRFGRYTIVRFDALPGNEDLFAVDVPEPMFSTDQDRVLCLLSGLIQQISATAYPFPGYPIVLRQAHNKVVITQDRAQMLQNTLRRCLPPGAYEFLKSLSNI